MEFWIGLLIISITLTITALCLYANKFKWSYQEWGTYKLQQDEKQKQREQKQELEQQIEAISINGKPIKSTTIIDSHIDYTDKLHAFLNYQEIIQHLIYTFLVTYEDDSTEVISAEEGSKNYNKLIRFITSNKQDTNDTQPTHKESIADELTKLKKLLDDGILTQEEFNKEKARLLK